MQRKTKTPWKGLRAQLEWLPLSLALMTIPYLSRRQIVGLARFLGGVGARLDFHGRRLALANISYVFPNLSPKRKKLILLGCYRNIARVLLDMFWFSRGNKERILTWVELSDEWRRGLETPGAKIIVTAHHGNWELAGHAVVANGYPLMSVGKDLGSKATTERLNAFRSRFGQEIVSSEGAIMPLLRTLRKGGNIALLADQYLNLNKGGIWTTFLGHPALTAPTPAFFAQRIKGDVMIGVAFMQARPDGHYRCLKPLFIYPVEGESLEALTQRVSDASSQLIRRFPTQWLYAYKRWRGIPEGADPKDFPFYARVVKKNP
jgi:Kdo2-lipid IVA lauroyltransferase/acyltransferase